MRRKNKQELNNFVNLTKSILRLMQVVFNSFFLDFPKKDLFLFSLTKFKLVWNIVFVDKYLADFAIIFNAKSMFICVWFLKQ